MNVNENNGVEFLQWALPKLGYRWKGFRKPRGQVLKRVKERMGELELPGGYGEYREYLERHPHEWMVLDSLCDVTISKFFRDRKFWDYLRDHILPSLIESTGKDLLAIWSAGCCNGEEPYSIAIIVKQLGEREWPGMEVTILASDRNPDVLRRAEAGRFPEGALKELRKDEIDTCFRKDETGDEDYVIRDRFKSCCTFEKRDIRKSIPERVFDIVFCRNLVFTYFIKNEQVNFLDRLNPCLSDNGYLVTGSNETIPDVNWLTKVSHTPPIYKKEV